MKELIKVVQKAIDEKKGEHPVIFEYHTLNPFIDYVVICSAPSLRQVYAIADNVADRVKEHGILYAAWKAIRIPVGCWLI